MFVAKCNVKFRHVCTNIVLHLREVWVVKPASMQTRSVSEIAHFYTYTYFFECTLRKKLECAKTQCTGNTSVAHSKPSKI